MESIESGNCVGHNAPCAPVITPRVAAETSSPSASLEDPQNQLFVVGSSSPGQTVSQRQPGHGSSVAYPTPKTRSRIYTAFTFNSATNYWCCNNCK